MLDWPIYSLRQCNVDHQRNVDMVQLQRWMMLPQEEGIEDVILVSDIRDNDLITTAPMLIDHPNPWWVTNLSRIKTLIPVPYTMVLQGKMPSLLEKAAFGAASVLSSLAIFAHNSYNPYDATFNPPDTNESTW